MSLGQRCAPALETPTGEIEPPGCEPLAVMCQTVVVDDLAQGRQRLGEHRRVLDARRPDRRVEVHRLVGVERRGQPPAHRGPPGDAAR